MSLNNYVLYGYSDNKKVPVGVVGETFEKKAYCHNLPKNIKSFLIEIEDKRFYSHHGIDIKGITRALIHNIQSFKIVEGGSTITQQLARNLSRDNKKTLIRKYKESITAIKLEGKFSKEEILTMYLNEVYWGENLYGIRAASLTYFKKEPYQLSNAEQIYMLTLLRGPNFYLKNPAKFSSRYNLINNSLHKKLKISNKTRFKNSINKFKLFNETLPTFSTDCASILNGIVDNKRYSIQTNILSEIQSFCTNYVRTAKYPTSIVCICKGKKVAIASSYGTSHPVNFKSNIGSLIKPFLYTFFRKNGILSDQKLNVTEGMPSNWPIREASFYPMLQNIEDGLFKSSNKVFVKAAIEVGIDKTFGFLSKTLEIPLSEIHFSTLLGATTHGISLVEIAQSYYNFFCSSDGDSIKRECLSILNRNAKVKFNDQFTNVFLKTGTTNDNKQRLAISGTSDWLCAILREENPQNDYSKEGNFIDSVKNIVNNFNLFFSKKKGYKWMS